jgi:hypothetical protein
VTATAGQADGRHKCPKNGCPKMLGHDVLACRQHWYALTPATRSAVNRAWWRGTHDEYLAAREAAVEEMNRA